MCDPYPTTLSFHRYRIAPPSLLQLQSPVVVLSPTIIGNLAVSRFRNSHPALRRSPVELAKPCRSMKFWLVICDIAMENHQFQWVNHRFLWQFSSSLCNQLPVGAGCEQDFRRMDSIRSYQIYPHPQIYICIYICPYLPNIFPKCFMVFPPFETHISYQLPWDSGRWALPWAVEAAPRCSWQQRSPCFSQVPVGYTHSH